MATPPTQPPPGWYPDPESPGAERWWDGVQWTIDQRPHGGAAIAPGAPTGLVSSDDKTWACLAHLSALAASLLGLAFIGPMIIYLVKREESPFVRAHAAAALNFQLSWLIWLAALAIATVLLMFIIVGVLLLPVLLVGAVAWLVLTIIAGVKAANGEPPMAYPLTIRFFS